MLRVFSDKGGDSRNAPQNKAAEQAAPSAPPPDDRIAQGFELLFGNHLKESRTQLERLDAEARDRLDSLEKASIRHSESIEDLSDKSRAALVREDDEYRRRKAVEADLREKIGQLRASIAQTSEELTDKIAQIGRTVRDEVETLRGAGPSDQIQQQQRLIEELFEEIALMKATFVDRAKLSERFAGLAREFNGQP
jgi:hypothetical protein